MAATFGSIGTALGYSSRANSSIAAPSGIADGDVLVLVMICGTGSPPPPTVTLPSGFSQVSGSPSQVADGLGFTVDMYVATKVASGESGSYNTTHSSAPTDGVILRISGASGTVVAGSFTLANGSNGQSETAASVTAAGADAHIIYLEHNWDLHGSSTVPTASDPTLTERLDSASSLIYVASGDKSTSGATGAWTQSDNDNVIAANRWQTVVLSIEAAIVYTLDQFGFRWRLDDGSETTATWAAAQNAAP